MGTLDSLLFLIIGKAAIVVTVRTIVRVLWMLAQEPTPRTLSSVDESNFQAPQFQL